MPRPIAIWNELQAAAYYFSSRETQDAWNKYAQEQFDLQSQQYFTDNMVKNPATTYQWKPPLSFTRWQEQREK